MTIPAGPRFIYQCLAWLEAGTAPLQPLLFQEGGTRHAFHTGEQVRIALTHEVGMLNVQKPDKTKIELDTSIFTQTDQIGVYTLFADGTEIERFTVNLLDPTESALAHSTTSVIPSEAPVERDSGLQPIAQEVWRFPALLALCILLLEWWFYHRNGL